jgi:hypothetical protein
MGARTTGARGDGGVRENDAQRQILFRRGGSDELYAVLVLGPSPDLTFHELEGCPLDLDISVLGPSPTQDEDISSAAAAAPPLIETAHPSYASRNLNAGWQVIYVYTHTHTQTHTRNHHPPSHARARARTHTHTHTTTRTRQLCRRSGDKAVKRDDVVYWYSIQ